MKRNTLSIGFGVVGLALIALLWSIKGGGKIADAASESNGAAVGKKPAVSSASHGVSADSPEQNASSVRAEAMRTQGDQRKALEGAIAAQEEILEEKRASLAQFLRSSAVAQQPGESQGNAAPDEVQKLPDKKVVGYVDLKKDYELEVQNLNRLKERLAEL